MKLRFSKYILLSFLTFSLSFPIQSQAGSGGTAAAAAVGGAAVAIALQGKVTAAIAGMNACAPTCAGTAGKFLAVCGVNNPVVLGAAASINALLPTISSAKSQRDACEKYDKGLRIAQTAMLTYNALCTAAVSVCISACSAESAKATVNFSCSNALVLASETAASCKVSLGIHVLSAVTSLANIIKENKKSMKCDKETTVTECKAGDKSCEEDKTEELMAKCSKLENVDSKECYCVRQPDLVGCKEILPKEFYPSTTVADTPTDENRDSENNGDLTGGFRNPEQTYGGGGVESTSSFGNNTSGGSGSGASGFDRGNLDAKVKAEEKGVGIDGTMGGITLGLEGSGGGGSKFGAGGAAYADSEYRDYMPGANKRAPANTPETMNLGQQVRGAGGVGLFTSISRQLDRQCASLTLCSP